MITWTPIAQLPDELKDGRWLLLSGGQINHGWDYEEPKPPMVVAQWRTYANDGWQFAWYDSGYYGGYENPAYFAEITPP